MSKTNTALKMVPQDNEGKAREYRRIQNEIKNLEDMAKLYRDDLDAVAKANGGQVDCGQYRIKSIGCKRENFSLKNAKQALGDKVLAPFISVSEYSQLKITIVDENEADDTNVSNA